MEPTLKLSTRDEVSDQVRHWIATFDLRSSQVSLVGRGFPIQDRRIQKKGFDLGALLVEPIGGNQGVFALFFEAAGSYTPEVFGQLTRADTPDCKFLSIPLPKDEFWRPLKQQGKQKGNIPADAMKLTRGEKPRCELVAARVVFCFSNFRSTWQSAKAATEEASGTPLDRSAGAEHLCCHDLAASRVSFSSSAERF